MKKQKLKFQLFMASDGLLHASKSGSTPVDAIFKKVIEIEYHPGEGLIYPCNYENSCDFCNHQEGRHFCVYWSIQMKNMDTVKCDKFEERIGSPKVQGDH